MNNVRVSRWTKDFIEAEIEITDKALNYIYNNFIKNEKGYFISKNTLIKIDKKICIFSTHSNFDQHFLKLF